VGAVDDVGAVGKPGGDGLIDINHCFIVIIQAICIGSKEDKLLLMAFQLWKRMEYEIEDQTDERALKPIWVDAGGPSTRIDGAWAVFYEEL